MIAKDGKSVVEKIVKPPGQWHFKVMVSQLQDAAQT